MPNDEQSYIERLFLHSFEKYTDKKIAIYGTGKKTEYVLGAATSFNIVGLLDGYKKEGTIFGKRVITIEEAVCEGTEIIIVVARSIFYSTIISRIKAQCIEHGILLVDLNANNLLDTVKSDLIVDSIEYDNLIHEIDCHDIIYFGLFDSLIMRKVLSSKELFDILEVNLHNISNFSDIRYAAEYELYKLGYCTIDDIYCTVKELSFSGDEIIEKYKRAEYELEKRFLIRREKVCEAFDYAVKQDKKVYIVSSSYYSKPQLTEILNNLNIYGYIDVVLYPEVNDKVVLGEGNILYVGPRLKSNMKDISLDNVSSFLIPSSLEMYKKSKMVNKLNAQYCLWDKIRVGILCAEIFNNPFFHGGEVRVDSGEKLSFLFIAPVICDFIFWLYNQVRQEEDALILFAARDGYLIQNLFNCLDSNEKKKCDNEYFLTSRSACISSFIRTEEDILYAASLGFSGDEYDLLKKRFFLDENEILNKRKGEDGQAYILRHKEKIYKKSSQLRNNYIKYIKKINLEKYKKILFFDFVSSGTCQMCLESIIDRKMEGLYFIHLLEDYAKKRKLDVRSFLPKGNSFELEHNILFKNYFLLESIITAPGPSLNFFDKNGNPVFANNEISESNKEYIKSSQEGIKKYILDIMEFKDFLGDYRDNAQLSLEILSFYRKELIGENVLEDVYVDDSFGYRTERLECLF